FARTGGSVSVTPGATMRINAGATVEIEGDQDVLSSGSNYVNVINDSTTSLHVKPSQTIIAPNHVKNAGNVTGVGNTTVDLGATFNVNHIRQNTLNANGDV